MGALTARTPKPLLPVAGVPILDRILRGLAAAGVQRAVLVTGYLGEQIEEHVANGAACGLSVEYCRQERLEGTARALLAAEGLIGTEPFFLSWGDILFEPTFYGELIAAFEAAPCEVQLAINAVDDPWRGAAVYVDAELRVTRIEEKPAYGTSATRWNNAGLFVFTPLIFDFARGVAPSPRGEYELPRAIAQMVEDGCEVRAHPVCGFWSDVGTPEDPALAERYFTVPR